MSRAVAVVRRVPWTTTALGLWTVLVFVFLFAPVVTAFVYSFNEGVFGRQTASFVGFTTHWYSVAWHNEALRDSVEASLRVAALTTVIATDPWDSCRTCRGTVIRENLRLRGGVTGVSLADRP